LEVFKKLDEIAASDNPLKYHLLQVVPHKLVSQVWYRSLTDCVKGLPVAADMPERVWSVEEMPLMQGSLYDWPSDKKIAEKDSIILMTYATYLALRILGIDAVESDKWKNMLWIKLPKSDPLRKVDFWKYTFRSPSLSVPLYVPTKKYLIKLGDVTSWKTTENKEASIPLQWVQGLQAKFPPPSDPTQKVAEVVSVDCTFS
jgi:hypothetical protein